MVGVRLPDSLAGASRRDPAGAAPAALLRPALRLRLLGVDERQVVERDQEAVAGVVDRDVGVAFVGDGEDDALAAVAAAAHGRLA